MWLRSSTQVAGLLSTGVGRLQGLGWLPMSAPLWDTSGLLSDRSLVGSFLGGLVGYRARPTALEVGAYMLYVVVAAVLIFGVRRPPMRLGRPFGRRIARANPWRSRP
jgi:high-affinity iron transporter